MRRAVPEPGADRNGCPGNPIPPSGLLRKEAVPRPGPVEGAPGTEAWVRGGGGTGRVSVTQHAQERYHFRNSRLGFFIHKMGAMRGLSRGRWPLVCFADRNAGGRRRCRERAEGHTCSVGRPQHVRTHRDPGGPGGLRAPRLASILPSCRSSTGPEAHKPTFQVGQGLPQFSGKGARPSLGVWGRGRAGFMGRGCPLAVSRPGQEEEAGGKKRPRFITTSPFPEPL